MINDFEITHEMADMPPEVWQFLKKHKFFAMIIEKKYGGLEFSAYAQACSAAPCGYIHCGCLNRRCA
ncbi:butyryl-CoA dehydrogenase [Vibrio ishigakensis]|uniref:Butyryl-CoA dehydrogenase n=1 Tax=Vibrio ishigakensis TaxID=1481914 RepID=A0A0B8Q0N8_9VIBR|nr:butyryl-CoA dehydrogenase [Vibrio ishigakensis]